MSLSLTVLERRTSGVAACLMLEYQGKRLLLDCGYDDSLPSAQGFPLLPIRPDSIDAVVLSHGHLGHCGLLPILVREGFTGKVYCPKKATEIAIASMLETALMQDEEAKYWKGKMPQNAIEPVYSEDEVLRCKSFFVPCRYHEKVHIREDIILRFFRAGHGIGSSFVQVSFQHESQGKTILYLGDVGTQENDLYLESVTDVPYDSVFLPAHKDTPVDGGDMRGKLAQIINRTCESGGNILIPVFSMDRRNAALKLIQDLSATKQIPSIFVCVDSPIASTQSKSLLYGLGGSEACQLIDTVGDSKSLNLIKGTAIIIAGSGRGDHGRIQFHLKRNLPRPENAIVLLGDYANETIWDSLLKGDRTIPILGVPCDVKAQIYKLTEPIHLHSAEVVKWLGHLKPAPKQICVTHGEPKTKADFQTLLKQNIPCEVRVPVEGQPCE